jgi:DNA-binding transcriptional LysR family regulator
MNDFKLQVFHTVVLKKSFSKTAEALHLTQPAITHQIRALEEHFGVRLFDRKKNEITLTKAGEVLFEYSKEILRLYEKAEESMSALVEVAKGRLRIGASTTLGEYVLPKLIVAFKRKYPKIEISLDIGNSAKIIDDVCNNRVDLGLVETPHVNKKELIVSKFIDDELLVIVSKDHPWANRKEVTLEELKGEAFIFREEGSGTREVIERELANGGIKISELNIKMELGSPEAVKAAVEAALGISILSKWTVLKEERLNLIKSLRIKELRIFREFNFILNKDKFLTEASEKFTNFLKEMVKKDNLV